MPLHSCGCCCHAASAETAECLSYLKCQGKAHARAHSSSGGCCMCSCQYADCCMPAIGASLQASCCSIVPALYTSSGETGATQDAWRRLTAICWPCRLKSSDEPSCACRQSQLLHQARRQASQVAQSAAHCTSALALQSLSWALPWCPSPVQQTGCPCLPFMRPVHTPEPEVWRQLLRILPCALAELWCSGPEHHFCCSCVQLRSTSLTALNCFLRPSANTLNAFVAVNALVRMHLHQPKCRYAKLLSQTRNATSGEHVACA